MQVKKIAGWAVVIFLAYFLLTKPNGAASDVQHGLGLLKDAGNSLATFFNNI